MRLYSKETYLESADFPFGAVPFLTMPDRPRMPHVHDFIELVYVSSGCGEHLYKGCSIPVSKGDVFVIPPYVEHDYRVVGPAPLEVYNILFTPSFLLPELQALSRSAPLDRCFYVEPFLRPHPDFDSHLKLSVHEGQEVKSRLNRLIKEYNGKALGYRIAVKTLLIELLVWLSRCYEQRLVQPRPPAGESKAIGQLCEYLERHYAEQLSLEQVSRMCGMSQSSFRAKFKHIVGVTFTEYRNEVRIHASLQYLRDTDDKIIDVAERVGIGDISYFNKLFKHYIGITPREYRLKYRQAAQKIKERSVRALGGTMEAAAICDIAVTTSEPTA